MGKKGIGSWELGVGEEGNSGLTLITSRLLSSCNSLNSALYSHSEHCCAEASYGTRNLLSTQHLEKHLLSR
uniref:Uncharacterized protein n=1 Tax=Desertifilum tharense IPPAS B-1220 TaxID=1781255 RepID=A0ACD5GTW4_9CYAN